MEMTKSNAVCVFCSSDNNVDESLKECTEQIGSYLGQNGMRVLTGGSEAGLMRSVANGFLKTGNLDNFLMIIPEVFRVKSETQHPGLTKRNIEWVESFRVQLVRFEQEASVFIVMPGGYGTLLEFFHLLNQKKHDRSMIDIVLFNFNGFWDNLLKQFDFMVIENTLTKNHRDLFYVATNVDDLNSIIFK